MRPSLRLSCLLAALFVAPASAARADEGMWPFNRPPAKELKEKHGFEVTPQWLEHVQRSSVRFSTGGSGSIVSAEGLVMTNHHVGSDILEKLSSAERNLLETGFEAATPEQEEKCPDLHLDLLWSIEDVTARVEGAAKGLGTAESGAAKRKAIAEIEGEAKDATGMHPEVVTLYQGGRYHLYLYKRYEDVRLVFAPEEGIAFYGGDNDNFEYPRYCLDVCFFRIYENDAPLKSESFLHWSPKGSNDGDLVFVSGHPGSTQRLNTAAHVEFLRDVQVPILLNKLMRHEVWLSTFSSRSAEHARRARGDLFSVQNSRKVYVGRLAGLLDPQILADKRAAEKALRARVESKPEWKEKWGGAWEEIAQAETTARMLYRRFSALGGGGLAMNSELFSFAVAITRLSDELPKPNGERLSEYADARLPQLHASLESPAPIYADLEILRLESALSYLAEQLGADDPAVVDALAGKSPRARAMECVTGTRLVDVEQRKKLAEGGRAAVDAAKDPMIALARALDPHSRKLRKSWEDEIQAVERSAYAKIAEARFAVEGENVYPDATFTLRLSYGTVRGYRDGDRAIEPYTEFAGLYQKSQDRAGEAAYALPPTWISARESVALATPYNFVSTCDIIGGNSGSPVVNRAGEVVGLIFDGNIQSLTGNYAYTDDQARAVSVDSRGILEAIEKVYKAERLASELRKGIQAN